MSDPSNSGASGRAIDGGAPLFTIEHSVEIAGSPAEVWAVLMDFASYGDWNPYVLRISGDATAGELLEVCISQANWVKPLTIHPEVVGAAETTVLHWRGRVGDGVLTTDHSFEIEATTAGHTRFHQREEFRGELAASMQGVAEQYTRAAFQAMNEALAKRVLERRSA